MTANWYPRPEKDTEVIMTAVIGDQEKEFTVTVAGLSSLLQEAADALTIEDADDVRGNLSLVKEGKNGVTIDWKSDNTDVITDEPMNDESLYDGGEVTRPAAGEDAVQVKLTAELSLNGQNTTKEFTVTVQPMRRSWIQIMTQATCGQTLTHPEVMRKSFSDTARMALHGVNSIKMNTAMSSRYL